jgi:hypothetical protein
MSVAEANGRIMHGALRIGDAVMELGEPGEPADIPTNGLFQFVEDVDTVYERALAAGATSYRPPENTILPPTGLLVCGRRWHEIPRILSSHVNGQRAAQFRESLPVALLD